MKRMFLLIVATILLFAFDGCDLNPIPEPEECGLCDQFPRHAPCVMNLSTGDLVELELYSPHPTLVAEVAEEQPGGEFYLIHRVWIEGFVDKAHYAEVTLPKKGSKMDRSLYCSSCRDLLSSYNRQGFVMADLRKPDEPVFFSIHPIEKISLRCYDVVITENADKEKYTIHITGTFGK